MPSDRLSALLVEDDDSYADLVRTELSLAPSPMVAVDRARSLGDAIRCMGLKPFDAVMLDLGLPDSSGLDTFERMQVAAGGVPILVLTGRDDDGLAVAAVQAGAQDYLVKSMTDGQLLVRALRYACERAQHRRQLVEREARFRALVEHSHETITLLDREMVCTYVSRAVTSATGYQPEDLIGRRMDELTDPEDVDVVRDAFSQALDEPGIARAVEYRYRHRNGSLRFGEAILINHLDTPGVHAVVANHRDVTQRKLAEEALQTTEDRLRQAHKMEAVGRLAGGIAHDFNNVLTAIFGYTDLLIDQFGLDDPRRTDIQEIRRSAERAASLTRQLLAFSRKQVLQPRVVRLNDIVGGLESLLRRLLGDAIRLEVDAAPDLWTVRADPGQIEQVLMNLCVNARDAMADGGVVSVATANRHVGELEAREHTGLQVGPYVVLTVGDSGPGIPGAIRSQIFEPFFTTKEQGKGTGLGLSTVYGIVKQSGGGIYLDSAEGEGATFSVYLPRVEEPAGPAAAGSPGEGATSSP
jgi:two-component system cell cycle sensor histidine kinase/response regulator CckA